MFIKEEQNAWMVAIFEDGDHTTRPPELRGYVEPGS